MRPMKIERRSVNMLVAIYLAYLELEQSSRDQDDLRFTVTLTDVG